MDYFIIDYNVEGQNTLALEDSIMQKGRPITAGSKMLDNFIAPINATVVDKLSNEYKIAGKTVMDEFGIPSFFSGESDEISGAIKAVVDNAVSFSHVMMCLASTESKLPIISFVTFIPPMGPYPDMD